MVELRAFLLVHGFSTQFGRKKLFGPPYSRIAPPSYPHVVDGLDFLIALDTAQEGETRKAALCHTYEGVEIRNEELILAFLQEVPELPYQCRVAYVLPAVRFASPGLHRFDLIVEDEIKASAYIMAHPVNEADGWDRPAPVPEIGTLDHHLLRQLGFLKRSTGLYDLGHVDEAVRIATIVRILIHRGSPRFPPLLDQLGVRDSVRLFSSYRRPQNDSPIFYEPLVKYVGGRPLPRLSQADLLEQLPVEDWWTETVAWIGKGMTLSRKELVLWAANKDGGAHVDDAPPARYRKLIHDHWKITTDQGEETIQDTPFVYLRQLAFELLSSPDLLGQASVRL